VIEISAEQLGGALREENPWWDELTGVSGYFRDARPRGFLGEFFRLVKAESPRREVVLLGPRRVGKTFLIHHAIQKLLDEGVAKERILYAQIDNPVYVGRSLLEILDSYKKATGVDWRTKRCFVFFDEIQYLKDWEVHLKALHDAGTKTRFVVSGSANAALGMGSRESGAGRFTDFLLPPLTFAEFIDLRDRDGLVERDGDGWFATDIEELNREFIQYLNFGGYPEVALGSALRENPVRFMRADIIDKVLLRDLPSLYGISDVRELNRLFTMLALNTGNEISLDGLAMKSAVSKNTLKRYMEYLEAAFLVRTVTRVDQRAGRFQRDRAYKVYLTNPSLRTGLFSTVAEGDAALGSLVETGILAQRFHRIDEHLHYARWKTGGKDHELDLVALDSGLRVREAVEVKYTDRIVKQRGDWEPWIRFCRDNGLADLTVTTRTVESVTETGGVRIRFEPSAVHAYRLGAG
jgi:predicted AAA+ superfamily ATPase